MAVVASAAAADAGGSAAQITERRLVSVLFLDLVAFTTLSEQRDAEDMRSLLDGYFQTAQNVIGRHGGVIEKFIGDAVMAVWGTPTTREDDAERAVRAGLELVDAVTALGAETGTPLQARCGVLTGEAATTVGVDHQGMVTGDMVNTASRLQSAADPGGVLVGEATYRAASRAIAFEAAGTLSVKGKEEPVAAWRALRVVAERQGHNRMAIEPPFVGRAEELRTLKELLHAAGREGKPRVDLGDGDRRHREVATVVGVAEVRRRTHGDNLVAPWPLPVLRRRCHVLGARRDGSDACWDRRDRCTGRLSIEARRPA